VKALSEREKDEEAKHFKEEVSFYTHQKTDRLNKKKNGATRMESCDTEFMFHNQLKNSEEKGSNRNMPVRQFFRNTFNNVINKAIFELKKKQSKDTENRDIFTTEGSVKFVANYLMENLPEGEKRALESMSEESN
jgi:hypothetical protein